MFQKKFFSEADNIAIVNAISAAENMTSGEIRLHVEPTCSTESVLDRATQVFYKLGMDKTVHQNGVLIYLAYNDHKFAIIGDKGINAVVPANFWDGIKQVMQEHFKKHEFVEGILFAVSETGFHLKQYFPFQQNDKNELSNEISEA